MAVDTSASTSARADALTNGHGKSGYRGSSPPRKQGFLGWVFSQILRISVWFTIVTIIFRCPKDISQLSKDSPRLCKPYLQVHSFTDPYVRPYYATYVEPYVQKAQPYIDHVQDKFISPTTTVAHANYVKYGAPQVQRAQKFGQDRWQSSVVPHLDIARKQAVKQYQSTLGPHVDKVDAAVRPYYESLTTSASDFWELEVQPAYKFASPYLRRGYREGEKFVLDVAIPYTRWANSFVLTALNRHVLPTVKVLYGENVEPQIMRIKQRLGRYRDEKKVEGAISSQSKSASSSSLSSSASLKSVASSTVPTSSSTSVSTSASSSVQPSAVSEPEKTAAEQFGADLTLWEQQVSRAVSEGAEHLKERVTDICTEQTDKQVKNVGDSLITQLEETESSAVKKIQKSIKSAVGGLDEEYTEDDVSRSMKVVEAEIRSAGKDVREKAQHIRKWRKAFDAETTSLIESAANSTLETIDNIRELRLQEIGRRWASHDGITHRDWANYNTLKKASGKWRGVIADIVSNHDGLLQSRTAAAEVEERAMAIAEDAAKELGRLKSVALWKLRAKDDTDDYANKIVPPVVAKVKEQVADAISSASEAVVGSSQGTMESVTSAAASRASDLSGSVSDALVGSSSAIASSASSLSKAIIDSSVVSAASKASSMSQEYFDGRPSAAEELASGASDYYNAATQKVLSGDASVIKATASSISSAASDMLSRASRELNDMPSDASKAAISHAAAASESIVKLGSPASPEPPLSKASKALEDASSNVAAASPVSSVSQAAKEASARVASESPMSAASEAAQSVVSSVSSAASDASSALSEGTEQVKSTAEKATSRVFAGAMAQAVPNQQPVFDVPLDEDDSELDTLYDKLDGVLEEAASITRAAKEAIYGKTETGVVGTATSVASDLWSSAYDAASSALYEPAPTEGGAPQFLSQKYNDAVKAASKVVAGFKPTPTPTGFELAAKVQAQIDSFTDSAFDKWQENIAQVQSVSAAAASRISEQISGTPKPIHEEMLHSVQDSYWGALHAARSKYDAVIAQTKKFEQSTQAPYESLSSVASENLAKALQSVSSRYSEATSAAGLAPTPAHQSVIGEAQRQYYEGIGFAHDQYSSYLRYATRALQSAGLPFVTPAPTPYYEMFLSTARTKYDQASSSAASVLSEALASASSVAGATSTSPAQSVLDAASSQYDSALSAASKLLYARQTPAYINMVHKAQSRHSDIQASASEVFQSAYSSALSAAGYKTTSNPTFDAATDAAWSSYDAVIAGADNAVQRISKYAKTAIYGTATDEMSSASSRFSEIIYGTEAAWSDTVASQAAANWDAIVSKASEQVYGKPSPVYASVTAQITSAAAQATSAAADQYSAVSSLFASLVQGQEADYTDKVFAQLSSAYFTGAASVASSISSAAVSAADQASSAVEQATSVAASVASQATEAIASVFSAPPAVEEYLSQAQSQIDAAISAASASLYGTPTGTVESVTSAAASAASSASSAISSAANYGYDAAKSAQMSAIAYAEEANFKIYEALFGEPEPTGVAGTMSSVAVEGASAVSEAATRASEVLFGAEKEKVRQSAADRMEGMIESARTRLEELAVQAKETASLGAEKVSEGVSSVVERVRDEL
ncbi:hypothetical protein CAC42_3872 [Sphaceloma murrayae]|uniref:Uncharacterized protein n=1 Tax=Sphaceloma murrayae TaxID=2082308 RepID=A0A2K1QSR3_9PEZI|nr:hypothetical protein CAC42_3872 [Sphaceloma murrayae]